MNKVITKTNLETIDFFDKMATVWDQRCYKDDLLLSKYIRMLNINKHHKVLDLACGTGVLIDHLLKDNPREIHEVDISEKMIDVAKSKCNSPKVKFFIEDFLDGNFSNYDSLILYNALPHFIDRELFSKCCCKAVKSGSLVLICHGSSKEDINSCHSGVMNISSKLLSPELEYQNFSKYFTLVDFMDSDLGYYFLMRKI